MQPMIAGLLFPLTAVLIESWFRKSYRATILTMPTPAELPVSLGSRSDLFDEPDANEPTVRQPVPEINQGLPIESGSGVS
jgi:hypothetical protein